MGVGVREWGQINERGGGGRINVCGGVTSGGVKYKEVYEVML